MSADSLQYKTILTRFYRRGWGSERLGNFKSNKLESVLQLVLLYKGFHIFICRYTSLGPMNLLNLEEHLYYINMSTLILSYILG